MILISNQEKGYFITATINHGSYIPEALHVERIDDMALYDGDLKQQRQRSRMGSGSSMEWTAFRTVSILTPRKTGNSSERVWDCILTIETGGMTLIRHLLRS